MSDFELVNNNSTDIAHPEAFKVASPFRVDLPDGRVVMYLRKHQDHLGITQSVDVNCRECVRQLQVCGGLSDSKGAAFLRGCQETNWVWSQMRDVAVKRCEQPHTELVFVTERIPVIERGTAPCGRFYRHVTVAVPEWNTELVPQLEVCMRGLKSSMEQRLPRMCTPDSHASVKMLMERINEIDEKYHLVFQYVDAIQTFLPNWEIASDVDRERAMIFAMATGHYSAPTLTHTAWKQSNQIMDFVWEGESVDSTIRMINERAANYGVTQAQQALEKHNVKSENTFSISWNSYDDFDLHCVCPCGMEHYWRTARQKCRTCGAMLDFDAQVSGNETNPVENLTLGTVPGKYKVHIHLYTDRGATRTPTDITVVVRRGGNVAHTYDVTWGKGNKMNLEDYYVTSESLIKPEIVPSQAHIKQDAMSQKIWTDAVGDLPKVYIPSAPIIAPYPFGSYEAMMANANPNMNKSTGTKKTLAERERENKLPETVSELKTWMATHPNSVRLTRLNDYAPAYLRTIETPIQVIKSNTCMMVQYEASRPAEPVQKSKSLGTGRLSSIHSSVDVGCPVSSIVEFEGSFIAVIPNARFPNACPGCYSHQLKDEFRSIHHRWSTMNTFASVKTQANPTIGAYLGGSTVTLNINGVNKTLKV